MNRTIPAQHQYQGIHARRHPHRDRNKHRRHWWKIHWAFYHFGQEAAKAASAFQVEWIAKWNQKHGNANE